jgi:aryl-alcohol dehydrogenase-like predicted oxidoreductase
LVIYRMLGRTGVRIAPLALGTMNFGEPTSEADSLAILKRALEAGVNLVDTANSYNQGESERILGKALRQSSLRDQVVLATKVYNRTGDGPNDAGLSRLHILRACEDSLRRLQTGHIDLYQLHRPPPEGMPQEETLRALDDLVRAGKVRYIGTSTFPAWMIMEGLAVSQQQGLARYISEQPPYNLLDRRAENEIIPLCQQHGLALLPWSPLAMGILAGRYTGHPAPPAGSRAGRWGGVVQDRLTRRGLQVGEQVARLAAEHGVTASQLALMWLKDQPGVTAPLIGPRTLAQLEEALGALELHLDPTDMPLFDALVHPGNAVSDFYNSNDWMKTRVFDEA